MSVATSAQTMATRAAVNEPPQEMNAPRPTGVGYGICTITEGMMRMEMAR